MSVTSEPFRKKLNELLEIDVGQNRRVLISVLFLQYYSILYILMRTGLPWINELVKKGWNIQKNTVCCI